MTDRAATKRIVLHGQMAGTVPGKTGGGGRVYLLSPANAGGRRAEMLFNPKAEFQLAQRLRTTGISLGEAFSFMSALYFRGKLAYTSAFARSTEGVPGALVITASRGLLRPETIVGFEELRGIVADRIAAKNPKYRDPLERDLRWLSGSIGAEGRVVLLGSIATKKYVPVLLEILGGRLLVPRAFVGLGNMQRGAMLLRCSREGCELEYVGVEEMMRKGKAVKK
jgi:hypothetical protein